MPKRKIYIGTSGWAYEHWRDIFYPKNVSSSRYLDFYTKKFKTVEINSSFYHLPKESTFQKWYQETPKHFLFSVKASRFITHIKRLKDCQKSLEVFLKRAFLLREKLGPILFQMPPGFKAEAEGLKKFLNYFSKYKSTGQRKKFMTTPQKARSVTQSEINNLLLRITFEFRHKNCFKKEIYDILRKHNIALCFADTPNYPYAEEETADFIYLRLHGHIQLYASCYSKVELKKWAEKIKKWRAKGKDIYCYFDNDAQGFAVKNALELLEQMV